MKMRSIVLTSIIVLSAMVVFASTAAAQDHKDHVWKYVVTEHREREAGNIFVGDYFTFPYPPCLTGPEEIGIHTEYKSMLIDVEDFDNDGDFDYLVMKVNPNGTNIEAWFLLYTNIGDLTFTETLVEVLGQYYFGIRYAAAFFERFVVKADRYQSAFLSQSHWLIR